MSWLRPRSLGSALARYELAFVLLVVVTGAMAGLWAWVWQQNTAESVRIHRLYYTAQQVRGDLFRQIKEVYLARLLEEGRALESYADYSRRIDRHFNTLRQHVRHRDEAEAVQQMQRAYRVLQKDMNQIYSDPYLVSRMVQMRVLNPREEQNFVGQFEAAFRTLEQVLDRRRDALETSMQRWTRLAPWLVPLPIVLAVGLLMVSRMRMRRDFIEPMHEVLAGAREMSRGALDRRIPERGVSEVAELSRALNHMAAALADSQAALVEQERQAAMGSLVPVVAHNIRNPLASIRASAQMLDHTDSGEERDEIRDGIIEAVDRLSRWVSALVSYLHPLEPRRAPLPLAVVVAGALRALGERPQQSGVRIDRRGWDEHACVLVDADLMEQALYGLLCNAVEASPAGGTVRVGIAGGEDVVRLVIEDEGPGMPFEPAPEGLRPGPTTKRFGTGLGIPVAAKVCRVHGWSLRFERAEGGGTRVVVEAPRVRGEAVAANG